MLMSLAQFEGRRAASMALQKFCDHPPPVKRGATIGHIGSNEQMFGAK